MCKLYEGTCTETATDYTNFARYLPGTYNKAVPVPNGCVYKDIHAMDLIK